MLSVINYVTIDYAGQKMNDSQNGSVVLDKEPKFQDAVKEIPWLM